MKVMLGMTTNGLNMLYLTTCIATALTIYLNRKIRIQHNLEQQCFWVFSFAHKRRLERHLF